MTRTLPAIAILLCISSTAVAQYPYWTGGFGLHYNGGRLRIGGYYYRSVIGMPGAVMVAPPVVVIERRVVVDPAPRPQYDLSGIDLDVETPDKLYPPGTAPPRLPQRLPAPRPVVEPKNPPPPPPAARLPPAPVKLPPPAEVKPKPRPKKPPVEDLWTPQPGATGESRRLLELGIRAFRAAEYGTARFRFRQAGAVDPTNARSLFLLAQAHYAATDYAAAVTAIHEGLKLDPDWPAGDFRPHVDLYGANDEDWREQRRRLDDALKRKPDDPTLLFLRGYIAWFDGQRDQAIDYFTRARTHMADPRDVDLFLKHAKRPAVAAG